MDPAIVLLEFDSIAVGMEAGDAMAKRAPLESLHTGSVQPGKYIILAGGEVGDVEEARTAGRETGSAIRLQAVDQTMVVPIRRALMQGAIGRVENLETETGAADRDRAKREES